MQQHSKSVTADRQSTTERRAACNSTYPKGGVSCSKDSFVVNQTLVLRINICGENRQLLKPANRYGQVKSTLQTMTPGNDKKYGRTFFDLIAEHPKLTFFIFLSQLA